MTRRKLLAVELCTEREGNVSVATKRSRNCPWNQKERVTKLSVSKNKTKHSHENDKKYDVNAS